MNPCDSTVIGLVGYIGFPLSPETTIGALGILGLFSAAVYTFCRWLFTAPLTPDPWGAEVEQAVEGEGAVPLCPHCLAPQEHNGWFCPECGSTVGPYSNYLPAVYIFSIGEAVRAGVTRRLRHPLLLGIGYVLIALGFLPFLVALIYLVLVLRKLNQRQDQDSNPLPT